MATKTITLELDAYERLLQAKRGRESFSEVVRRARFDPEPSTGEAILQRMRELEVLADPAVVEYWDAVSAQERAAPSISVGAWDPA